MDNTGNKAPGALPAIGRTVSLTVGTAGHIDHGKTSLIRLLTGCDTDTLPEERSRGMTIDLGFAVCELPNNRRVGLVDVPGHERFIHNMVAGASGMDVVLLVVAADDGVMPQTVEHFHIVRLLGITSGMVVITKTDIVPPERVAVVTAQVRELLAGSPLAGCPVAPVSTKTGDGFSEFYDEFVRVVDRTAERNAGGPFRMHIESTFVLKGLGVIVSGIPRSGRVGTGDEVVLLPAGSLKRVKGIQTYGVDSAETGAGKCAAIRLGDTASDEVARGMVLAAPGHFTPERFIGVKFHLLPGLDLVLKPRTAIRCHIGTSDVPGHLVLPGLEPLRPGAETYAQLQLRDPVVAAPGDFFVARMLSPVKTLGGGSVLAPDRAKMRRSAGNFAAVCEERDRAFRDPESAVRYVLAAAPPAPLSLADIARESYLNGETAGAVLEALAAGGAAIALRGGKYVRPETVREAAAEILGALSDLHDRHPISAGFDKKELMKGVKADRLVVERAFDDLVASGDIKTGQSGYLMPSRAPKLKEGQALMAERIKELYLRGGFGTARRDELPALLGAPQAVLYPLVDYLIQTGELVALSDKVILHRAALAESRDKLVAYLRAHGSMDSGVFKDVLGTTRKYSIPILEYWDGKGLTRRTGNTRTLRNEFNEKS